MKYLKPNKGRHNPKCKLPRGGYSPEEAAVQNVHTKKWSYQIICRNGCCETGFYDSIEQARVAWNKETELKGI